MVAHPPPPSIPQVRHAILRFERRYWRGYPVSVRVGSCWRVRDHVDCTVTARGVWIVGAPAQWASYTDVGRASGGHIRVAVA